MHLPFRVLSSREDAGVLLVLLDPDEYVSSPGYRDQRRGGAPALKNLRAFTIEGRALWEAELPESADYFYRIESVNPLTVLSFSSHRCTIDRETGKLLAKESLK